MGPRRTALDRFRGGRDGPQRKTGHIAASLSTVFQRFFFFSFPFFFLFFYKRMYIPRCLRGWLSTLFENRKPDGRSIPAMLLRARAYVYVYIILYTYTRAYTYVCMPVCARGYITARERSWWDIISIRRGSWIVASDFPSASARG